METKRLILEDIEFLDPSQSQIEAKIQDAGEMIRRGEVVAFPTETVYGLGANALDEVACRRIFEIKGRPQDNPLIVHVSSLEEAAQITKQWPEEAQICAQHFWPGPLTLVLPKSSIVPDLISAGLPTVGVRMPSHPIALALIRVSGRPLAAPSANVSGKPSPTDGDHVWQDLKGRIPLIIDGGRSQIGLESTVLDLSSGIPTILRPGGVTREELEQVLDKVELDKALGDEEGIKPRSPGMKYRHYAPEGKVDILHEKIHEAVSKVMKEVSNNRQLKTKIGVLCMNETAQELGENIRQELDLLYLLGSQNNQQDAASRLFQGLRLCDEYGIQHILVQAMEAQGIGLAFMNRLQKASGNKEKLY